jgi:hypothetical protein
MAMNFLLSKNIGSRWVCRQQHGLSRTPLARQWAGVTTVRHLSADPNQDPKDDDGSFDHLPRLESANPDRITGIRVNPASLGSMVLPGNLIYKKYKWSGNTRKIPLELEHGYFWMMRDLQKTDSKPTLSNESLIPEEEAQLFPILNGLSTLSKEKADLPFFFVDKHKGMSNNNNNCIYYFLLVGTVRRS